MSRLMLAAALSAALAGAVHAQPQAEIAARLNEEGKDLMFANKYAEATAKFRDAVARVPEPKYFFNLCTSLYQEGKFGEALTACNAGDKNADDKLKGKIGKLSDKIKEEAQKQGIALTPTGGGGGDTNVGPETGTGTGTGTETGTGTGTGTGTETGTGTGTTTGTGIGPGPGQSTGAPPGFAVGRPPTQSLYQATAPSNTYTWTLGVDLFGGGSSVGQKDVYGTASFGVRFKGDYMVRPASRLGVQAYLQLTNIQQGKMDASGVGKLDIFDLGIAGYKNFCQARGHLCLTPLVGVQLAMMDPNQDQASGSQVFNYAGFGARGEINLSYAFGTRNEYVLQAMLGTNLYTKVLIEPNDGVSATAEQIGLDKGGAAGYLGLGFTYRFSTPFGSSPFVTLE
jgi:hypothetical protein